MPKLARTLAAVTVAALSCALVASSANAAAAPPALPVTGASLMVAGARQPLWSQNGARELPIASTTKLMTFLVVRQHVRNLNTVYAQTDWVAQSVDSQIGLIPGERMTVNNLLWAMMLPSADDAAEDLAYNVGGGSVARFISWMNADARALGLRHTHYATPIGLDTPGNYSSPNDLVRLAGYLMHRYPLFREIAGTSQATITSADATRTYHLVNTDDLLAQYPWIHGVKTGHTTDAGYVLVSAARRGGLTLLSSVLGTASEYERDQSALRLLSWGFKTFREVDPVRAGAVLARAPVAYQSKRAELVAASGYHTVIRRGTSVQVRTSRLRTLKGPLAKGARVGSAHVIVGRRRAASVPLVLAHAVPAASAFSVVTHTFIGPLVVALVLLALVAGAVGLRVRARRRRPRVRRRAVHTRTPR